MKNFELANIIENILLFDRVYVDPIILPILIDLMYEQDYKGTIKLIKKRIYIIYRLSRYVGEC